MFGIRTRDHPGRSASADRGTSQGAGASEPCQCGNRGARHRALTTLVEAALYAIADVGSIPTVSTFRRPRHGGAFVVLGAGLDIPLVGMQGSAAWIPPMGISGRSRR